VCVEVSSGFRGEYNMIIFRKVFYVHYTKLQKLYIHAGRPASQQPDLRLRVQCTHY
jgi:hypothetical protein